MSGTVTMDLSHYDNLKSSEFEVAKLKEENEKLLENNKALYDTIVRVQVDFLDVAYSYLFEWDVEKKTYYKFPWADETLSRFSKDAVDAYIYFKTRERLLSDGQAKEEAKNEE